MTLPRDGKKVGKVQSGPRGGQRAVGGLPVNGERHSGASVDDESKKETPRMLTFRKPSEILALATALDDSDMILGDRLLAESQPFTICGQGGIGKSRLLLQLAACQILGADFIGMETHGPPRRWIIVQTENTNRRLSHDLAKLRDWSGDRWSEIDEKLVLHTLETDDDSFVNIEASEGSLAAAFAKHQPDIVVFDPLNAFTSGDLNSDVDMRAVCVRLSRVVKRENPRRALVVLHHALTGRSGAAKAVGFDRASFGRNSKVLLAWTRGQINLSPASEDDNETLVVSCGKNSNGREFKPFAVRLNPETMLYEVLSNFDFDAWKGAIAGKPKRKCTAEQIANLVGDEGVSKGELVKRATEKTGVSRASAYRLIEEACQKSCMRFDSEAKKYFRANA